MASISKKLASEENVKIFIVFWCLVSMPVIAWLPAKFWVLAGNLWCLEVYPVWLDRFLYSIASPYLSQDMSMAAEQMEFLEVWIASALILEIVSLVLMLLLKDKFND